MEELKVGIIAQALIDYAAGDLPASWFDEQAYVNLDFSKILPLVRCPDVLARLTALVNA